MSEPRHPNLIAAELDAVVAANTLTVDVALRLSREVGEYWMARAKSAEADADRLVEALRVCATDAERSTPAHADDIQWRIKVAQPMVASALKAHDAAVALR